MTSTKLADCQIRTAQFLVECDDDSDEDGDSSEKRRTLNSAADHALQTMRRVLEEEEFAPAETAAAQAIGGRLTSKRQRPWCIQGPRWPSPRQHLSQTGAGHTRAYKHEVRVRSRGLTKPLDCTRRCHATKVQHRRHGKTSHG